MHLLLSLGVASEESHSHGKRGCMEGAAFWVGAGRPQLNLDYYVILRPSYSSSEIRDHTTHHAERKHPKRYFP